MNWYYHPDHDAVAQCADCGKGLCRSCATRFTIPICPECNGVRRRSELRGCIVPLLLCGLLFAIGYNSEFMGPDRLFGAYMLMSVYGGWKFINRFCPFVFVWFSVEAIFWYFLIKVALRRGHADDNAVRAERGKALHLTAEQLKFAFRIQKIAAARTQQHTNRYGNPFPHHAEQILIRRSTADH